MRGLVAAAVLVACRAHGPQAPAGVPREGLAIAIYRATSSSPASADDATAGAASSPGVDPPPGYAVVDDRRWIEIAGDRFELEHVDPGASLAALVIESVAGPVTGPAIMPRARDAGPWRDVAPARVRGVGPLTIGIFYPERGGYQVGGGIAGDFPICVVPMMYQDLEWHDVPFWSYFCQVSDSTTSYGSYSGAVPNEKITWGKLDIGTPKFIVESDATIVVPLIFAWILGW